MALINYLATMKSTIFFLLLLISTTVSGQSKTEAVIKKLSAEKYTLMNPTTLDKLKTYLDDRMVFIHSNVSCQSQKKRSRHDQRLH